MPTAEQVRRLPELARLRVPHEWEDLNGHVNVQHHLQLYNLTTDRLMALLGISRQWVEQQRIGIIDLEHHIWFQRELFAGEEVAAYLRFTARSVKRVHGTVFMLDETDGTLASAIEFLSMAIDLDARRAVPLPDVIARNIDNLLRSHETLGWAAPASGAIHT
jgi:acyl-CoA thioester hydrolase